MQLCNKSFDALVRVHEKQIADLVAENERLLAILKAIADDESVPAFVRTLANQDLREDGLDTR